MFGGMDKRQMEKMMKQLGIKSEEIEASEVVIKAKDRDIIITEPQVTKIDMGGAATFQVAGKILERRTSESASFSDEDVRLIMEQTGATEKQAKEALASEKDLASAIIKLKK